MAANWQLANGGGFQNALATGLQIGQGIRQQRQDTERRNALVQQQQAQMQRQQQTDQRQQLEQRRADLPFVGKLLGSVRDEASYQQARGVAQQYGLDLSGAPPSYDPQWVESQKATVQALSDPKAQEALSTFGKIATDEGLAPGSPPYQQRVRELWQADQQKFYALAPGGGLASVGAGGNAQLVIAPNPGTAPAGAPISAQQPQAAPTTKTVGGRTFYNYGGKWYDEPMGGGGSNVTGNFPGSQ